MHTLALLATVVLASTAPNAGSSPNVVLIFADDLGYGDLGCFGNRSIRTPNLDRLAKEGVRLTNFYVPQAVCSASRAALLTGCYPNRIGIQGALNPSSKIALSPSEVTIARMLKSKDYATGMAGKWHLGHQRDFLPTKRGFDEYYGLPYSNDMWPKHPTAKFPDLPLIAGDKVVETNPDQSQLTTAYTDRAVKFLRANQAKKFFLYVAHTMPHVPLFVSEKHKGKSKAGLYGDVIEELDWSVGQILDTLKQLDLEKNTLVIFTSDNGPWLSYGNHGGSAGPLREGKATSFEGGVRVPCIARWPGKIPAGGVCAEPAMTIDVLPTLAHLAGTSLPRHPIDGKDITALLTDPKAKSPHEALYFYWNRELQAIRSGKWKLHFPHSYPTLTGGKAGGDGKPGQLRTGQIELSLFDLERDAGETTNVAKEYPDVVQRLQTLAETARQELGDSATKREGRGVRQPGRLVD